MSVSDVVTGQLELHTVFGANAEAWDFAARALASGILDPEKFITHEFVLEDAMLALDTLADKSSGARKILLHP
jgi:threonine dehydrogenase-like Zn-dependent dehydrogenase